MNKLNLNKLKDELSIEQIINLLYTLGADRHLETEEYLIFPTICHNLSADESSMKLYYYTNTKLFHCYTECNNSFNIYTLFEKYYKLHNINYDFYMDIILKIVNIGEINTNLYTFDNFNYKSIKEKYKKKNRTTELSIIPEGILSVFMKKYPPEWLLEGISQKSMDKYNILFSSIQNKIIIPHYNINGELIGIRGRALNENEVLLLGKYMPVRIEDKWYAHHLSLNLYGLNIVKENIQKEKKAIIYEGEKSCLLSDTLMDNNIGVAVCGSIFSKTQLDLLIKNFKLEEIIIAFDKEYEDPNSKEGIKYFYKLHNLCSKYKNYVRMSFIYDYGNLLRCKDSPIDKGKDIFLELLNKRIEV